MDLLKELELLAANGRTTSLRALARDAIDEITTIRARIAELEARQVQIKNLIAELTKRASILDDFAEYKSAARGMLNIAEELEVISTLPAGSNGHRKEMDKIIEDQLNRPRPINLPADSGKVKP